MRTTEATYRAEMRALEKQLKTASASEARIIRAQAKALTRAHIASTQVTP